MQQKLSLAEAPAADASLDPHEGFRFRLGFGWCLVVAGLATAASGALGAYVLRDHYSRLLAMLVPGSAGQTLCFGMMGGGITMTGFGVFHFMISDDEWWTLIGILLFGSRERPPRGD